MQKAEWMDEWIVVHWPSASELIFNNCQTDYPTFQGMFELDILCYLNEPAPLHKIRNIFHLNFISEKNWQFYYFYNSKLIFFKSHFNAAKKKIRKGTKDSKIMLNEKTGTKNEFFGEKLWINVLNWIINWWWNTAMGNPKRIEGQIFAKQPCRGPKYRLFL